MRKVAVIGCGRWGKNLVRNFYELGELELVCDNSLNSIEQSKREAPDIPVVNSLTDVLRSNVRGVVIATPAESHYKIAKASLLAGKDTFVEKPMSLTYEDGLELVKLADKKGLILMVGHVLEYHPAVTELRHIVRRGDLGNIRYIYSNRLNLGQIRTTESVLWSFAPHDIAVILQLVGQMPEYVYALGEAYIQKEIADVTITNLSFSGGIKAHIFVSWLHPFKEQKLVVVGSEKMVLFDDVNKRLVIYNQRADMNGDEIILSNGGKYEVKPFEGEPLKLECQAFLNAIESRDPPLTDGRSGLRVLRVLEMAHKSLITESKQGAQYATI